MTLQEKELLTRFLQQLDSAPAPQKDAEAEAQIRDAVARRPDAAYLLVQRTLQLEQLLQASQERVKKLEAGANEPRAGTAGGFVNDPNAWGSRPSAAPAQKTPGQRAAPAAGGAAAPGGSWSSGLFGNIAATAAGVVAGSFLFQGIQGLMKGDEANANTDAASTEDPMQQAQAEEPELLNSYFTEEESDGSFLADADDGGDFA